MFSTSLLAMDAPPRGQLAASPCSAAPRPAPHRAASHRALPRFDTTLMTHYLCDAPALRDEVYELFRQHPELLVAEEEGLTKGEPTACPPAARRRRPPLAGRGATRPASSS